MLAYTDSVHAKQMYPDRNVDFVKMDSKIIPTAQVIDDDDFWEKTLFLQFYVNCTKEVFSHLQVYTIYLVNYCIRKLAHGLVLLWCS